MATTTDSNIHAEDPLLDAQEAEQVIQHSDSLCEYQPSDEVIDREVIDKNGDVLIQTSAKEFLVSSKILAVASPVFEAMFKSNFLEGSTIRNVQHPLELPLPDDDPDALAVLLHTSHFSSKYKLSKLKADLQLDIAQLCDKYDCKMSVYGESGRWLRSLNERDDESSVLWTLSTVAFLMGHVDEFSNLTTRLMLKSSAGELERFALHSALPESIKRMSRTIPTRRFLCKLLS